MVASLLVACPSPATTPTPTGTSTPTGTPTTTPTTTPGGNTVKMGLLGAFTGSYAPYGGPIRQSALTAVRLVNEAGGFEVAGKKYTIDLVQYDDRTDTKRSVAGLTMMRDLYDIRMIMGPFTSPTTLADQPVAEASHIIFITTGSATEITRPGIEWTWGNTIPHSYRARFMNKYYVNEMGAKTVAVLTENNATYLSIKQGSDVYWAKYGATVVANDLFEMGTTDFSTIIARLRRLNPDVLHVNTIPASSILIVKQCYEAGWHVQIVSYVDVVSDDLFRSAGPAAEGVMGSLNLGYWGLKNNQWPQSVLDANKVDVPWYMQVSDAYIADWTNANIAFATTYYTHLNTYIHAMQKAGTTTDIEAIHTAMYGLEFQDPNRWVRVLPNHHLSQFTSVAVFHQSALGATSSTSWPTAPRLVTTSRNGT